MKAETDFSSPDCPDGVVSTRAAQISARWSAGEIREYLRSGLLPDGEVAGGAMAEVIDGSLRYLTDEGIDAIVV